MKIKRASLNHTYRLVWSSKHQMYVAVAEINPTKGKSSRGVVGAIGALMLGALSGMGQAYALDPGALPTGGNITHGQAQIVQSGNTLNINQSTDKLITNWNSFNIGQDATVNFNQPSSNSSALNRVVQNNPSQILGNLNANGKVFLINPSGIVFGENAQINVGSLVASTLNMSDDDFLAGNFTFKNNPNATASIENYGKIRAQGGVVAFIANRVVNHGEVVADNGQVAFAAGNQITLDFTGDGLITLTVDQGVVDGLIENGGLVQADNGVVIMATAARDAIYNSMINNTGLVQANSLDTYSDGRIRLTGSKLKNSGTLVADGGQIELIATQPELSDLTEAAIEHSGSIQAKSLNDNQTGRVTLETQNGLVAVSGTIDVSSNDQQGGTATVTGKRTLLTATAQIKADGATGGGTIQVGGSWQNSDRTVYQAEGTIVAKGATLTANATDKGKGGTVVVWSDITNPASVTRAYGSFEAKGGANGGDGGRIETSGYWLDVNGIESANTLAPQGQNGVWLLDPAEIEISNSPSDGGFWDEFVTNRYTWDWGIAGDGSGVSVSTVINVSEINNYLNNNGEVSIVASGDGVPGGSITVNAPITWTSTNRLQLAAGSLTVNQSITGNGELRINLTGGSGASRFQVDSNAQINTAGLELINVAGSPLGRVYANNIIIGGSGNPELALTAQTDGANIVLNGDVTLYLAGNMRWTNVEFRDSAATLNLSGDLTLNGLRSYNANGWVQGNNHNLTIGYGNFNGYFQNLPSLTLGGTSQTYEGVAWNVGSLTVNAGNTFSGTGGPTGLVTNNGTVQLSGNTFSAYTGSGTLRASSGASQITNFQGTGPVDIASGATLNLGLTSSRTLSSALTGAGNLSLLGAASPTTFTVSGNNTGYTGNITVNNNIVLNPTSYTAALGNGGGITVNNGGVLLLSTNLSNKSLSLNGNGNGFYSYALGATSPSFMFGGPVTLGSASTIGNVTLGSTLNGAYALSVNGATTFNGNVSVASLTNTTGAPITLNSNLTASGAQTYGSLLTVTGARTLTSSSGQLNFNAGLSANNNLTLSGSSGLTIAGTSISAPSGWLTLQGGGTLTTAASLASRDGLLISGFSNANLASPTLLSGIPIIAAQNVGNLSYVADRAFTIGTVNGVNGISATGTIDVATNAAASQTRNLTVAQNVSTSNTSSTAITLTAGRGAVIGEKTAGDIQFTGTPAISADAGGIVRLYSGSVDNTTFPVGGDYEIKYGADESTVFDPALEASKKYIIYREIPFNFGTVILKVDAGGNVELTPTGGAYADQTYGDVLILRATISTGAPSEVLDGSSEVVWYLGSDPLVTAANATAKLDLSACGGLASCTIDYTLDATTLDAGTYTNLNYVYSVSQTGATYDSLTLDPKALTLNDFTAQNKVYDGNVVASVTGSFDGIVSGDTVNLSGSFNDKNVGTGKTVTAAIDNSNYSLAATSTTANITRLESVTWTGGANGNWFDPANWAGGAVPDLANVANVVIPDGVNVSFDQAGVVAPAETGPVSVDRISMPTGDTTGALSLIDGQLTVANSVDLGGFIQSGGTLVNNGTFQVADFSQSGGTLNGDGDLTVSHSFAQTGGSIDLEGDISINQSAGDLSFGVSIFCD